jgi:hypothetical protein
MPPSTAREGSLATDDCTATCEGEKNIIYSQDMNETEIKLAKGIYE